MIAAAARSAKPIAIAVNYSLVRHEKIALETTLAGVPVLDGTREALLAVRHALRWRDFQKAGIPAPPPIVAGAVHAKWHDRLRGTAELGEDGALDLLADYGIAMPMRRLAATRDDAIAAAQAVGFPVALKTAAPGIAHKTEAGGVRLGLADPASFAAAYDDVSRRLGREVLVERMVGPGTEIALGAVNDPQFGPYVMVAAGGVLIELLADRAFALAPIDTATARALIERLKVGRLLAGLRGAPPADVGALAECLARLSVIAAEHRDTIAEIDVNPVIAGPQGCVAVDALVVRRGRDAS